MSSPSFWQRMGNVFRNTTLSDPALGDATIGRSGGIAVGDAPSVDLPPHAVEEGPPARSRFNLLRLGRDNGVDRLRGAYERVVETLDSLERHFEQRDQRSAELGAALGSVAQTLEHLVEAQRAQGANVQTIARRVEALTGVAIPLTETLARLPASVQVQTEAVRTLLKRIDAQQEFGQQLTASLERFGSAAETLRTSGDAQVETLRRLGEQQREQQSALGGLLREQSRRFTISLIVTAAVAVCACATLAVWVILRAG